MFPIPVWQVVSAEFAVYDNVVFLDATNNGEWLIIESDEVSFLTNIGKAVVGDDLCAGVAIKSCYHHPRLYFLDAV